MIILIIDEPQPIKYLEETIDLVCEMKGLIVVGCIENSLAANNFNQYQHEDFGTDYKLKTNIEPRTSLVLVKHENPNCPIRGTPC